MMLQSDDLSCQELVELVTDYLEDALAPAERTRFEDHLRDCAGCQTYLEQMRHTIRLVGRLRGELLDPAVREQLLGVFRSFKRGSLVTDQ